MIGMFHISLFHIDFKVCDFEISLVLVNVNVKSIVFKEISDLTLGYGHVLAL